MTSFDVTTTIEELSLLGGSSMTVTVAGGDTLYYSFTPVVSSSQNNGSLTSGSSLIFTEPVWLVSRSRSSVQVTYTTATAISSDGTGSAFVAKSPRGLVVTPDQYGAKGDAVTFLDGAIQAGSSTLTSASFTISSLPGGAGSKRFYIAWAGAGTAAGSPSAGLSTGAPITSIPRTSGAAIPAGPILIQSGAHAQLFWAAAATSANASITVQSQTPNFAYPTSSTITYGNTGINGTIQSVANGSATLSVTATNSVQNMIGWFGTDDSAAINSAITAINAIGGGTLLFDAKNYIADAAPSKSGTYGNAVLPVAQLAYNPITLEGVKLNTTILTTRLGDTYDGTNGLPSLFGGPTLKQLTTFSGGQFVTVRNLQVKVPENGGLCAFDFSRSIGCEFDGFVSVTSAGQGTNAPYGFAGMVPSHPWVGGIILPQVSNGGAVTSKGAISIEGMYFGVIGSEHNHMGHIYVENSVIGLGFPAAGGGGHANTYDYFDSEECQYNIAGWDPQTGVQSIANAGSGFPLRIRLDIEDLTSQWSPIFHILDANNMLLGVVEFLRFTTGAVNSLLALSGGGNLTFVSDAGPVLPNIQVFSSNGTWTKPPTAKKVTVILIGSGSGGESGATAATSVAAPGGIGGGCANEVMKVFSASDLTSTVAVTVGASAAGGAAVSASSTSGNFTAANGGKGGNSTIFGAYLQAAGGQGNPASTGPASYLGAGGIAGGLPNTSTGTGAQPLQTNGNIGAGGAGGSLTTGNSAGAGATGGAGGGAAVNAGAGGSGAIGGNGSSSTTTNSAVGGAGGGGGAANAAGNGFAGGNGGFPGGGGGGGGAARNGSSSGAGGNSGAGLAIVISE